MNTSAVKVRAALEEIFPEKNWFGSMCWFCKVTSAYTSIAKLAGGWCVYKGWKLPLKKIKWKETEQVAFVVFGRLCRVYTCLVFLIFKK